MNNVFDSVVQQSDIGCNFNCFMEGPGEILLNVDTIPSFSLTSIDYDNDMDMDFIMGGYPNAVFIVTKYEDYYNSSCFYILPDKDGCSDDLSRGGMASADFNNDGQKDFIIGGVQGIIRLFVNNHSQSGVPHFDIYKLAEFGQSAYGISSADFDDDGLVDFAVSHASAPFEYSTISIFYNQGNLTFKQDDVYRFNYSYIQDLDAGDYDNDGDIDFLYTYNIYKWHGKWPLNVVGVTSMLTNEGDETFDTETVIAKRGHDLSFYLGIRFFFLLQVPIRQFLGFDRINPQLTSADYDNDGDVDFLVGDNSGMVEFFINDGHGNFSSSGIIHNYGSCSWGLASADFDGDDDIDFIVAADKGYESFDGCVWLKRNQITSSGKDIQHVGNHFPSCDLLSIFFSNIDSIYQNVGCHLHMKHPRETLFIKTQMKR
ncbi:MAG: VCBS repeat-containing protein [Bacteroidales bacterium]|nr:VCBS repeat-containing protein [Bacteroidales bacterium]